MERRCRHDDAAIAKLLVDALGLNRHPFVLSRRHPCKSLSRLSSSRHPARFNPWPGGACGVHGAEAARPVMREQIRGQEPQHRRGVLALDQGLHPVLSDWRPQDLGADDVVRATSTTS